MRCPHCAVPMTLSPVCWACGLAPDAPVQEHKLEGFEPTRFAPVHVKVALLPELVGRDVVGSVEPLAPVPIACATCGDTMNTATKCPTCGAIHAPRSAVVEEPEADAPKPCPYCGVPNPVHRSMCVNCAGLIGGGEHAL
jgi:hypothetical protein